MSRRPVVTPIMEVRAERAFLLLASRKQMTVKQLARALKVKPYRVADVMTVIRNHHHIVDFMPGKDGGAYMLGTKEGEK